MEIPKTISPVPQSTSRRNLAAEVAATLREEIISGKLLPVQSLGEPMLAARFGVSRAPIREALLELEREGLVVFSANGRTRVRALTEQNLVEVVDARMALEAMGVRRAVELWTPEDSEAMTVNIRAQSKARSLAELSRLDVEMHEYIMRRSENELLVSLWLCIKPRFEMWLAHTHRLQARLKFEPRDVTVSAHEKLLRIIESGDREKAAAEMSAHIESWREWIPTNVL